MRSCRPIISHTVDARSNFRILLGKIRGNPALDLRGISCSDITLSDRLFLTLLHANIED
jgi:DNA replication initiation complex subunit (GINS family)